MKAFFYLFTLGMLSSYLLAEDANLTPQKVEVQLEEAEAEFQRAQKMFNPWYAGPLLTGSAHVLQAGSFNVQPYLFVTDNYASYDESGDTHSISDLVSVNPLLFMQAGIYKKSIMTSVIVQGIYNHQKGHSSTNFGDTSANLGFGIFQETVYRPALLFQVQETFPSGKYQRLNPNKDGVDSTGGGAYRTQFTLNASKIVWWWWLEHPMNFRLSLNYVPPAHVHVKGFNSYGGGYETSGNVLLRSNFIGNIGYEFSFTQRWAFACDFSYTYAAKTSFRGKRGVDESGNPAGVGGPFKDQLSLAPAIEYNPSSSVGLLAGVWFSVWGRNSLAFVSGVLSVTASF